jgi:hypothetical protein
MDNKWTADYVVRFSETSFFRRITIERIEKAFIDFGIPDRIPNPKDQPTHRVC